VVLTVGTSLLAGFVPNPLSSLYASTKSFLTLFATSIAAEVRSEGIDVVVVHPSPIASNFFDHAGTLTCPAPVVGYGCPLPTAHTFVSCVLVATGTLDVLMSFKKLAVGPSVIADVIFSSAGRFVVRDQGLVTILFRVILKFVDFNFFW
jgi:short-subunit dehydrogenase